MLGSAGSPREMVRIKLLWMTATVAGLTNCAPNDTTSVERFVAAGELVALSGAAAGAANACFTCHGLRGEGDGAFSPRLAGLDAGYLERQLIAYADGRRDHPQMGYIAENLTPLERRAVSLHYAAMPEPRSNRRSGSRAAQRLYHAGDPQRGLASCASCHGERGEGIGPANPPLAGQPAGYVAAQLDRWRHSKRRSDPDGAMLRISQLLSPAESAALGVYAAALPGGPPSPESLGASPEARRGDPRSGASGPPLHVPESARAAE